MPFWHLGTATLIVYLTLGRARIDYRFILLGAIAPDVVDAVIGSINGEGISYRGLGHTLLAAIAVSLAVILITRGELRLSLFGVGVGWLIHLVIDGMWSVPKTFPWPAFGDLGASRTTVDLSDPKLWLAELAGLGILVWFWVAFEMGRDRRWARWLKDGKLRA